MAPARIDDFGAEDRCETSKHVLRARALHVVLWELVQSGAARDRARRLPDQQDTWWLSFWSAGSNAAHEFLILQCGARKRLSYQLLSVLHLLRFLGVVHPFQLLERIDITQLARFGFRRVPTPHDADDDGARIVEEGSKERPVGLIRVRVRAHSAPAQVEDRQAAIPLEQRGEAVSSNAANRIGCAQHNVIVL